VAHDLHFPCPPDASGDADAGADQVHLPFECPEPKLGRSGYDAWPGVTFDIESEEGKAILGTPNGAGTAWLLIQRKRELGRRRIEKVTVFHAGMKEDMFGWPSLLFWIV
jgi:hypothetical protein